MLCPPAGLSGPQMAAGLTAERPAGLGESRMAGLNEPRTGGLLEPRTVAGMTSEPRTAAWISPPSSRSGMRKDEIY